MASISCCTNNSNALVKPQGLSTCQRCVLIALLVLGAATIAWATTALVNPTKCPSLLAKSFAAVPRDAQIAVLVSGALLFAIPAFFLIKDSCKPRPFGIPLTEKGQKKLCELLRKNDSYVEIAPRLFIEIKAPKKKIAHLSLLKVSSDGPLQKAFSLNEASKKAFLKSKERYEQALKAGGVTAVRGRGKELALLFCKPDGKIVDEILRRGVTSRNKTAMNISKQSSVDTSRYILDLDAVKARFEQAREQYSG